MTQPSKLYYFYAADWPTKIWMTVVTLSITAVAGYACRPSVISLENWLDILLFVLTVLLAALLGWFLALLFGWFILGPLYYARAIKNGAPFQEGDYVRVLVGPFRDRVARVYDVWKDRGQVRVELGETAKTGTEDVFSESQVCREEAPPEAVKDTVPPES